MSIITKPSSIVKGAEASITLNKADLVSKVVAIGTDAYYEDSANWSKVILQYGSSTGNQKEIISFDATQSSPTSTFLVSDKALDIFEVHNIIIVDFDGGVFSIPRSELVTAEFDAEFDIDTTSSVPTDLVSRIFTEPAPAYFILETAYAPNSISNGLLNMYAFDTQNRYPYNFTITPACGIPDTSSGYYKMRLYFAPINDILGVVVQIGGGYIPNTSKTINSTDILNGYLEFPALQFVSGWQYTMIMNTGERSPIDTWLRISSLTINPM